MPPNHQNVEMLGTDGFTNLLENWQTVSDCNIRFGRIIRLSPLRVPVLPVPP
jgi:hypothetical protein